jgi:hypothetical protein
MVNFFAHPSRGAVRLVVFYFTALLTGIQPSSDSFTVRYENRT